MRVLPEATLYGWISHCDGHDRSTSGRKRPLTLSVNRKVTRSRKGKQWGQEKRNFDVSLVAHTGRELLQGQTQRD
jgi:hypothetical protein